jgi:SulP family sulfate permease
MINWSIFKPALLDCFKEKYTFATFRKDFSAGLTVSIVSLPLAMAFAIACGASPASGLFTTIVAGLLISLMGGSRFQISGPTGAFVVIVYNVITQYGYEGLVIATLMAGVILIIAAFLNAGSIMRYIPQPVITGFTAGIAVCLFTGQIRSFLGLDIASLPADFIERWVHYAQHIGSIQWPIFALGGVSLAIMLTLQTLKIRLPVFLLILSAGSLVVWGFHLPVETIGSTYGALPTSLPAPSLPPFVWHKVVLLFPSAVTIAFLAGVESLLSATIADGMTGQRHHSNTELLAHGVGNIVSVIFGGLPATGAIARTITNVRSGALTPVSGIIHALLVFLFMVTLSPIVAWVPLTCLAAVMIVVAWNMSEIKNFRYLMSAPKSDRAVLLITFVLTVLVDLTVAVQIGMVLAALLFMKRMNDVTQIQTGLSIFRSTADGTQAPLPPMPIGVEAFQITGPFFFSVANRLKDELEKIRGVPKVFILRMRHVPTMDATAAHTLDGFLQKCKQRGTTVIFAAVQEQPRRVMRQMGIDVHAGLHNFVDSTTEAVKRANEILSKSKPSA